MLNIALSNDNITFKSSTKQNVNRQRNVTVLRQFVAITDVSHTLTIHIQRWLPYLMVWLLLMFIFLLAAAAGGVSIVAAITGMYYIIYNPFSTSTECTFPPFKHSYGNGWKIYF